MAMTGAVLQRHQLYRSKSRILSSPLLNAVPSLIHGFSSRLGGHSQQYGNHQLNLGFTTSDNRATVARNRADFLQSITGKRNFPLVTLKQVHSDIIHVITKPGEQATPRSGDGAITNLPGVLLGILTADCLPVLVVDPKKRVAGAFHAGWRGTAKRIVQKGVGTMRELFGSEPQDLCAAIGPGIHQCCYAIGDEVIEEFESQFAYAKGLFREVYDEDPVKKKYPLLFMTARAPGHSDLGPQIHLDLVEANRRQLLDAGVRLSNIWAAEECTSCRTDLFFSHRAESGYTGRMMSVIGLKA
jgi:polyphenol oxidase